MHTILSSKGQIVLPVEARRKLRFAKGERLTVEVVGDGLLLRAASRHRGYRLETNPTSGLKVMVPTSKTGRKVTADEIARLNSELP